MILITFINEFVLMYFVFVNFKVIIKNYKSMI